MVLVLLTTILFFVFGTICTVLSIPSIVWALAAICSPGKRIHGFFVLFAGAAGIAAVYFLVQAIHSNWLPVNNIFLGWLGFLVPYEQPYSFFIAWAPIGFVGPATFAAFLTGGHIAWRSLMKSTNKENLNSDKQG